MLVIFSLYRKKYQSCDLMFHFSCVLQQKKIKVDNFPNNMLFYHLAFLYLNLKIFYSNSDKYKKFGFSLKNCFLKHPINDFFKSFILLV